MIEVPLELRQEREARMEAEAREARLRRALGELVEAIGGNHGKRSERDHIRKEVKGKRVTAALREARSALAATDETAVSPVRSGEEET